MKRAFTLSEVLVTLGIIGVVSAMTVPTLMQNYQRKSYVTQLHKVYNEVQQAAVHYITEKNAIDLIEAGINSQAKAEEFVTSNFKIVQTCTNSLTPCFADSYKSINGTAIAGFNPHTSYVLASGAAVRSGYYFSGKGGASYQSVINLLIDINGKQGPNIQGRDFFNVGVYPNGVIDEIELNNPLSPPFSKDLREELFNRNCLSGKNGGYGCFGKILNDNWEMTY